MQAKRGAGRAARTPAERQDWTAHFKAQVQSQTPPAQARRERVQLARTHRRQKVLVPLTKLQTVEARASHNARRDGADDESGDGANLGP